MTRLSLSNRGPALLAVVVLLFGGGGAEGAHFNGLISAAGAFALVAVFVFAFCRAYPEQAFWPSGLIPLGLIAIPLAQLVPLPPDVWRDLSGREAIANVLAAAGNAPGWRPLSLAPDATVRAATFLLLPSAAFFAALLGSHSSHRRFVLILAICAGISAVVGAAQLILGHPNWISFYDGPSIGSASGIFANPNHQALFMVFGLVAAAIIIRDSASQHQGRASPPRSIAFAAAAWGGMLFFALMTLASGARAGVMLLAIGLPGSILIAVGRGSVLRWAGILFGSLAMLWIAVLAYPGTNTLGLHESFKFGADARYAYLPDILYTLSLYWPVGSGLGSFITVFTPNESLELAGPAYLNHAHNDFLEFALETGLLGMVWLALAILIIASSTFKKLRAADSTLAITLGALLIVALAVLHSLADYPLRTATLAVTFAFAVGLLCRKPQATSGDVVDPSQSQVKARWKVIVIVALAAPIAFVALKSHLAQRAIRSGNLSAAAALEPGNARVLVYRSEEALSKGQFAQAESFALSAIIKDPLLAAGLRQLALSRTRRGLEAGKIWTAASTLGWRDIPTQLWAFRQALLNNELEIAALRADALLRTNPDDAKLVKLIRVVAQNPLLAVRLVDRIRLSPPWRAAFFSLASDASRDEVAGVTQVLAHLDKISGVRKADARSLISYLISKGDWDGVLVVTSFLTQGVVDNVPILKDGGFNRTANDYESDSTSFDWQTSKGPQTSGHIETQPPSRLIVDSNGEASAIGAERYLVVNRGKYRITYASRSDTAESFVVKIACASVPADLATRQVNKTNSFEASSLEFSVPSNCTVARLTIEALPGGTPATAEFDDFRVTSL